METRAEFPHCNAEVLHAPGNCEYCDLYPERQKMRIAGNTPFTPFLSNGWSGNVASPAEGADVKLTPEEIAMEVMTSEPMMWLMVGSNHVLGQIDSLRPAWKAFIEAGGKTWGKV